jgi:hypothetical protein
MPLQVDRTFNEHEQIAEILKDNQTVTDILGLLI